MKTAMVPLPEDKGSFSRNQRMRPVKKGGEAAQEALQLAYGRVAYGRRVYG